MSSLNITPLSSALGAQISGVDISQPLNLEQRDAIEQALLKYQVLFFRNQPIEAWGLPAGSEKAGPDQCPSTIKTYPKVSQFWTYDEKWFLAQPVYSRDYPPLKS